MHPILLRWLPRVESLKDVSPAACTSLAPQVLSQVLSNGGASTEVSWVGGVSPGGVSPVPSPLPSQVMILVAKKKFPRAVDRNSIRRKVREAWRLHAADCLMDTAFFVQPAVFLLHYVATVPLSYEEIRTALCQALHKLPRQSEQTQVE